MENPYEGGYFNFEVSCIGTALAALRRSRTDADHFSDERLACVRHFGSLPHAAIDSFGEGQRWWMVEIIPFALLGVERTVITVKKRALCRKIFCLDFLHFINQILMIFNACAFFRKFYDEYMQTIL